jgi:tetratricopeptide (TPR) repeat protein
MHFLELGQAVNQIKNACRSSSEPPNQQRKFFFIIGAGTSLPSVPLAGAITTHCKQHAEQQGHQGSPEAKTTGGEYSYWLEQAYPQRSDRQNYLRSLIEGKPIPHANLRLAHLLLDPEIANLVVTTNFDDFLSRALTLFGQPHVVCDHPNTTERIDPERDDVQIVHVHGSYWFYDCCNLTDEIARRSERSDQRNQTMASLLDRILANRSPIVVGYSGWENDVIMQALKRRLNGFLPNNLYWFLHKRPNSGKPPLPDWIWEHSDVKFVAPRESQATSGSTNTLASPEKGDGLKSSALDAQQVFSAMIESLELEPPLLTQNPLQHFKEHLENSLPQDEGEQQDPYGFQAVIAKIERAKEREQEQQPDLLEPMRDALRKAQYYEAIQLAREIPLDRLENDLQRQALIEALWSAACSLFDDSSEEVLAYQLIADVYDALSPASQELNDLQKLVANALFSKGFTLGNLNRYEEEIAVYDTLLERFSNSTELALQEQVANALFNKGITLGNLNRSEEAIAVYDSLLERFSNSTEPALQEQVANALFNKGVTLGNLNRYEEEIAVYDSLLERFSNSTEPALQERVANALFSKGATLGNLNRLEEEIAIYDILLERFSKSTEPALQERVANALFSKGFTLGNLNRLEEAIVVYDNLLERFSKSTEPAIQEQVANALGNRGFTLLCQAKKIWSQDVTRAKALLSEAQENVVSALERVPQQAVNLENLGYVEFLLGNVEKARTLLTQAIQMGGETIRQDALKDSEIDPIPQDEAFRQLVHSIKLTE